MNANKVNISLGIAAIAAGLSMSVSAQEIYGPTPTTDYQGKIQAAKPMAQIASRDARNLGKMEKPAKSKFKSRFHGLYDTTEKVGYDGIVNP